MTATTRLVLRDKEALRAHLDMLNEQGMGPIAVGADDWGRPFLITLVGPYAEGEAVFFDSPWQTDVTYDDGHGSPHCDECNGWEWDIDHLKYPVTILQVLSSQMRVVQPRG